jgi:aldose 1-epimerase
MDRKHFGIDETGREAVLITLNNQLGMKVTLTNFGARLVSIICPDKKGETADVCLGFDTLKEYQTRPGYLGATIGRWANRIAGASFKLNGKEYSLFANDGANTLHGGREGFDKKVWEYSADGENQVIFRYTSPDGEEGFPGTLQTSVTFTLGEDGSLTITYEAQSDQDTVINLTNHAYFNLAGSGTVHGHLLQVNAAAVAQTGEDLIPDGNLLPVAGTPFDLLIPSRIGDRLSMKGVSAMFDSAKGYDVDYVLSGSGFHEAAVLKEPSSGRVMRVLTDQPGIQVYSGQGLNGPAKNGAVYGPYSGIALETQHHPDSVHHTIFPSTKLLAGQVFRSKTAYIFKAEVD